MRPPILSRVREITFAMTVVCGLFVSTHVAEAQAITETTTITNSNTEPSFTESIGVTNSAQPASDSATLVFALPADTTNNEENDVLRAQLEMQRGFQSDILSTVYWALASILVIAAALAAGGWWVNFRLYERDKQAALDSLRLETRKAKEELLAEQRALIDANIETQRINLLKVLNEGLEGQEKDIESLGVELRELQCSLLLKQAKGEQEQSHIGSALGTYIRILHYSRILQPLSRSYYVDESLNGLIVCLKGKRPFIMEAFWDKRLSSALDNVGTDHLVKSEEVRRLMKLWLLPPEKED